MPDVITFEPQLDRPTALRPIIGQFLQLIKQRAEQSGTLKISVGPYTIEVTSWERAQVADVASSTERASDITGLLLEGIAAQARALNSVVRLTTIEPENTEQRDRCRREIVFDLALGESVRRDAERLMAELSAAGRTAVAMNLESFVARMTANLAVVRAAVGEGEAEVASVLVDDVSRPVEGADAHAGRPPAPAARPASGEPGDERSSAKPRGLRLKHGILAGVATAVLVVGTLLGIPLATQRYQVEDGFRFVPGVERWSGAPPAATVTVSTPHWKSLTPADKTSLVFAIAAALQKEGFTRAKIVGADGAQFASWSREEGVKAAD